MPEPSLIVKELHVRLQLGKHVVSVVENLSFNLYPGKTLCLVGESGCGKTMAALSLLRILPQGIALPSTGEVWLKEKNLLTLSEKEMRKIRGRRIAMIFQDPSSSLNPVYTIGNQLIEAAELHLNLYGEEAEERAILALKEVGISHPEDRISDYPHQMSGGMKQRAMIAMALMCQPDVLIADEPTTALDVTIQAQVLELIRHLQTSKGMSVLLITHDMGIVAEMADDVIVMYAAQAAESGDVYTLFDHMAHPYTKGLFDSRPSLRESHEPIKGIPGFVPSPTHHPKGCRFHPRCPFVMEKCRHGHIPYFSVQNQQHQVKCLLYDGTEESLQKKEF